MKEIQVQLGRRIRQLRIEKGWSQQMLSARCQLEKAGLSRLESGFTNPTLQTLWRVSQALEVPLISLFES